MNQRGQIKLGFMAIIAIPIALLLLFGGVPIIYKLLKLMNTPVLSNSVPIWLIALVLFLVILFLRRR